MSKKILAVAITLLIVTALIVGFPLTGSAPSHETKNGLKNVEQSFTLILVKNNLVLKGCISPHGKPSCEEMKLPPESPPIRTMGSGAVVAHGINTTYIITAGHVCTYNSPTQTKTKGYTFFVEPKVEIKVMDYWGKKHDTTVVAVDNENDICVLRSRGIWSTPLPVARKMPKVGDRVTTIAAPRGIFYTEMVLKFDGYYVGLDDHGHAFFTTPTAPGSSGSVILNSKGQIVSVIHSAMRRFENVGLGSQVEDVLELLRLNVLSVRSLTQESDGSGYLGTFHNLP